MGVPEKMTLAKFTLLITFLFSSVCTAASFDCNKAASLAEMAICNDPQLSKLDEELASIYKQAKKMAPDLKRFKSQSRKSWKWREANCHNKECLLSWYSQRKITLEKIAKKAPQFVEGVKQFKQFSFDEAADGTELRLNAKGQKVFPTTVGTYFSQTQLVLSAAANEGKHRVRLPYSFETGYQSDGEMSWERRENNYVLLQHDFTQDGVNEVLFAVITPSKGLWDIEINILQFHPPAREVDLGRSENWSLIGRMKAKAIVGDPLIKVGEQSVTIPRNIRGFYYETTWAKSKFVDTGNY